MATERRTSSTSQPAMPSFGTGDVGPLTDREFRLFQDLIYDKAGIRLGDSKRMLLVGRLRNRIRTLGLRSFTAYHDLVLADPDGEMVWMLDAITTNETHFFREPKHFEFLEQRLIPGWKAAAAKGERARHIRIWSAASSSGEEPYTLAMVLLDGLSAADGWTVEVLASDISTRVLDRAALGIYPIEKAKAIPERYLKGYMLKGVGEFAHRMKVGPEARQVVSFRRLNLNDDAYPVSGPFDAIFCRNVLIYFDPPSRERVLNRLIRLLAPGAHLFLGHAEGLTGRGLPIYNIMPSVYSNQPPPDHGRRRRRAG